MIERSIYKQLIEHVSSPKITIIIGARQTGKTSLLKQVKKDLESKNQAVIFLSLEDKTILALLNKHPNELFSIIPNINEKMTVLIDEIQYLSDPSSVLKYLYDLHQDRIKLVVTGSSAFYIDQKFRDSLAGRKRIFKLQTFNFREFLKAKNFDVRLDQFGFPIQSKHAIPLVYQQQLRQYMQEYCQFGGYPEVVLAQSESEKKELLNELYFSFLKKDFLESGIKYETKAYQLLRILAEQVGSLLNKNELSKTLGLSQDAIDHYLYIMEKSFIIKLCSPFHKRVRKELIKMPKVYFLDVGYRNIVVGNVQKIMERQDKGQVLENLIFQLLTAKSIDRIQFWRTQDKHEVDFICESIMAYELKFNEENIKPSKYKSFRENYPEIDLQYVAWESRQYLDVLDFI
jgi:predicted AAA+ superfamily ATPase